MYGHDAKGIRSRYDYYYSVSSPSLSQAANYFENQASLFGEPIAPLLPAPMQKSPSPKHIQTPLSPFHPLNASTTSSATNYVSPVGIHPPMIENFDNHLYESIRRNIMDQQNNNIGMTDAFSKHQLWTQNSNSSENSPPNESTDGGGGVFESRRKRASTAFGHYKSDDDVSQNKYRTLSAHGDARNFHQISTETASDTDNNNRRSRVLYANKKPTNVIPLDTASNSSSSKSKLNISISHSRPPKKRPPAVKPVQFTMVKSKSDLNTLRTYPDSFTIVTSPKRSPSAGYQDRRKKPNEEDDDSIMEFEWVKPPPELLYEAAKSDEKHNHDEPVYIPDHFGQMISMPTSPIITDKIMVGSRARVQTGSNHSHRRLAFAIVNDFKNRKNQLLQHRHSDDNMSLSGRFSPYSRYVMQRELSAPTLNRVGSIDSEDSGFFYFIDENGHEEHPGRQTSIGFAHEKKHMSASMSNLSRPRPKSEMRKNDIRYMSTPNFIKINKRAVIQSTPMQKINPRLILHRSLRGVLKVYNNTNIKTTKKAFSIDKMDIFLPNGKVDPNFLAPMPISVDDKRSMKLNKHQAKSQKQRLLVMKRRKLSPIAGTPSKDSKDKEDDDNDDFGASKSSRRFSTPKSRMEERLKKDKFGRLATPKKAALPNFRATKKGLTIATTSTAVSGKRRKSVEPGGVQKIEDFYRAEEEKARVKKEGGAEKEKEKTAKEKRKDKSKGKEKGMEKSKDDKKVEEASKEAKKGINFMDQVHAKGILGRTIKAKLASKNPPPLTRQGSKQSIESYYQEGKPALKKKSSFGSIKSLTGSIKTLTSFGSKRSGSIEDEEAEAGDEITKLKNLKEKKGIKAKVKGSILSKSKILGLASRINSATSLRSLKDSENPPVSRSGSKTSLFSRSSSKNVLADSKSETPTKKSENLRAPSASSVMSMTTAAITSNPLNTTLTITNQLATQGAEIIEKRGAAAEKPSEPAGMTTSASSSSMTATAAASAASAATASHPDADRSSMASNKTTSSKTGSRINSATPGSAKGSARERPRKNSFIGAAVAHSAIRFMRNRQKSGGSIRSEKDDGTHLTMGPGDGNDNEDYSDHMAGEILEKSQKSLERVQKTVDKATSEIHQTINANLTDLKTLEKKLSKGNLLEHDDNNNNLEKAAGSKDLSRHSSKLDMVGTSKGNLGAPSTPMMSKSGMMAGTDDAILAASQPSLQHQSSDDSNQMNSSTSSSMNEMTRKRKICCGLSSCCGKTRSESAQMIAGKSSTQPLTTGQKCGNCCCLPFRKIGNLFKRRKVDGMEANSMDSMKPSFWERMCCCCGCCRRCKKKGEMENMENMAKKMTMQDTMAGEKKPSCWSRMNCFKCCKPCCSKLRESCCCSSCCRKKDSMQSAAMKEKDNSSPGTCTRIFCFCCVCCRKKPEDDSEMEMKRPSMTSQKGSCCSRMCDFLLCCRKKKKIPSRRTSMLSKKQSLATTLPPEEQKPKLDMVLVEHASLMKGAIPVLPVCLAYFLLICNIILPGTGTIMSGFFCLCIGIPRFSQHDGARGRIGSFIINWIVGVSQAFTIIFCFVGWGWSIWWGMIMLQAARRFRRIRKAERLRDEDEENSAKSALPGIARSKETDPEKGII